MTDRLPSGSDRTGLRAGRRAAAARHHPADRAPGTGKTILAQQYLFHNATERPSGPVPVHGVRTAGEDPAVRPVPASTSTPPCSAASVIYDDLGQTLNDEGLPGVLARITDLLKQRRPGLMVIDSFKALRAYESDDGGVPPVPAPPGRACSPRCRSPRSGSANTTAPTPARPRSSPSPTRSCSLSTDRTAERETRVLQVLKLRGSGYLAGKHAYRLSPDGLDVFPRLADPVDTADYGGHPGTDVLRGRRAGRACSSDGYWRGASTLIAGPSGIGKTLLALHFVFAGAAARRNRSDRHVPGKPGPTRTDPARLLLVAARPRTSS